MKKDPKKYVELSQASMAKHVELMLEFQKRGAVAFDYGNNIRQVAFNNGVKNAFDFPGFVPAYIRPLFCEGKGPFRFAALSGDPKDIERADEEMRKLFPENEKLLRWLDLAEEKNFISRTTITYCLVRLWRKSENGLSFKSSCT